MHNVLPHYAFRIDLFWCDEAMSDKYGVLIYKSSMPERLIHFPDA
uniref:Uncharacterized protein n=1 Tax=Arundo donax TaxID=35708 RepID=A0A0A9HP78_ARUDO